MLHYELTTLKTTKTMVKKKILVFRKPQGSDITELNKKIDEVKDESVAHIQVSDIKTLTDDQCELLRPGDMVIKVTDTHKHSYRVSYKGATGLCLTYSDCDNVETVAYEKGDDGWAWDSTDITPISSLRG